MKPRAAISGGLDLLHHWNNKNYFFEVDSLREQLAGHGGLVTVIFSFVEVAGLKMIKLVTW